MKQRITREQLDALPDYLQAVLAQWFEKTLVVDDGTFVHVYIPQERRGPTGGVFYTWWGEEDQIDGKENIFYYPEPYQGKLRSHHGTVLPLMDIGQMIAFIAQYDPGHLGQRMTALCSHNPVLSRQQFDHENLVDFLWKGCNVILASLLVQENQENTTD